MIGNTDWRLYTQKNVKLIKHADSELYTIVPYDFDFAKIVEPPYIRYDSNIPNLDEYNRAAKDVFSSKESFDACLKKFLNLRETGFSNYKQCTRLSNPHKREMTQFLKTFFKKAKNKQSLEAIFLAD